MARMANRQWSTTMLQALPVLVCTGCRPRVHVADDRVLAQWTTA